MLCLAVFTAMALGCSQSDSGEIKQVVSNKEPKTTGVDKSTPDGSKDSKSIIFTAQ